MNYFRYIPMSAESAPWGISVTAAGFTRVPPHSEYPPTGHPDDHSLSWEKGRILGTFQIVFILEGRGTFESASFPSHEVTEGTAFLLFPQEWHRYTPQKNTGWVESWLELDGEVVRRLRQSETLNLQQPLHMIRQRAKFKAQLDQVHAKLRDTAPGFDPELSAAALSILAQFCAEQRTLRGPPTAIERIVTRAQTILTEADQATVSIPVLARKLGVGYSHFRREFKQRVGLSPKRYQDRIRLERGRRMLGGTSLTLGEIAQHLGYASSFHFSTAFKREFGTAPSHWRRGITPDANSENSRSPKN